MTDNTLLFNERIKRIDDAVRFNSPDRVPHISFFYLWMVHDYGAKLSNALKNWELSEKIYRQFMEKYQFDANVSYMDLFCHPFAATDVLGKGAYALDDEKGVISLEDIPLITVKEYPEFINNPGKYTWDVIMPRKFENFNNLTVADFQKIIDMFDAYLVTQQKHIKIAKEDYGVPNHIVPAFNPGFPGIEMLINFYSGLKETALAMRRKPGLVDDFCAMFDQGIDQALAGIRKEGKQIQTAFDLHHVLLGHTLLNEKQWERYYWPWLKKVCDKVVEEDITIKLFSEGTILRFADYFRDYPKGHIAVQTEQDDIYELAKALPNCCMVGGITSDVLSKGTKEECISQVKDLIENIGERDGGLILTQNKMMTFKNDANPENMKAVCDYIANL